jgi:hypothetical protein
MFEGPTVAVMGALARDLHRFGGATTVQNALVPIQQTSSANGTWETGYDKPDQWLTKRTQVTVYYKPNSSKKSGIVNVKVADRINKLQLVDRDYELKA